MDVYQQGWKPPVQHQKRPGLQNELNPPPVDDRTADGNFYKAAGKLAGKTAIVTGADLGIGRSVGSLFALEGADLTMTYLKHESPDKKDVEELLRKKAPKCKFQILEYDLRSEDACWDLIQEHVDFHSKGLDILVCNHGTQNAVPNLTDLPTEQWHETFDTNIHSFFYLSKAALPQIPRGGSIIFNASINPQVGNAQLVDYTATKGAIIGLARALSNQIVGEQGVRVNSASSSVAPGPIWTPLIPATMTDDMLETFGTSTPIERAGQPIEVATSFVFLASSDSSYMSGQVLNPNGGVVIA